ncbi:Zn-ribbon domain-containing OB-fold protein [Halarchaeum nitratireducens]|uniref:DUF35 domain-containing protein n=1 Tax=Halarchaeum nitratireducens TaxID=489913 RepID=A0A830G8M1_9EURY|nr:MULTISPECIES: Zn-ribbon domain-containing OB-fold protein [Halarchaeum]MBP2249994.1 putative OB-fold protein [Halarchaeum solikamskense]GGN09237.1 hypothetical protein GCM10009021_05900 [Halarchaeum nitratireducens]
MSDEPPRGSTSLPDSVDFPRLFDFYEIQSEDETRIHEFYANLDDGSLTTTECADCGELHFPPRVVCPECTSDDLSYASLPHTGTLHAFSVMRAGAPIGKVDDLPFVVGIVDLDGVDVRLSARIDDAEYDDLTIGDPVTLKVVDIEGPADLERVFYRFVPADADADVDA